MTSVDAEDKFTVYGLRCICHPEDGIRYVGQTVRRMADRLWDHRKTARSPKYPVNFWIAKHGPANIEMVMLEECATFENLAEAEMRWIADLGTRQSKEGTGLNLTDGGVGVWGWSHTEESRAKMREGKVGRVFTDEWRANISRANRGKKKPPRSAEHSARISAARLGVPTGRKMSDEERLAVSVRLQGEGAPAAKLREADIPEIFRRRIAGETLEQIAEAHGVTSTTIGQVLRRRTWGNVEIAPEMLSTQRGDRERMNSNLNTADVLEIRRLRADGKTFTAIAEMYSMSRAGITDIVRGVNWGHVAEGIIPV